MVIRKFNFFIPSYILALLLLASAGYLVGDYTIAQRHAQPEGHFVSDVSYLALPPMTLAVGSADGTSGKLRMHISLEVERKNKARLEGLEPIINDQIVDYVHKLDIDNLRDPKAVSRLREELLQQVNAVSRDAPVVDIVFREFVVM